MQATPQVRHKSSKESAELKQFIRTQTKRLERDARVAIFEHLPELYLQLQREFDTNPLLQVGYPQQQYEKQEAMLFYKGTPDDHPLYLAMTDTVLGAMDPSADENIMIVAAPNHDIRRIHSLLEMQVEKFKRTTDKILTWFQHLLPKRQEKSTDTGSHFLLQIIQETNKVYEDAEGYSEKFIQYHQNRAAIVKTIRKGHACFDQYMQILMIDYKELFSCREFLATLLLNVLNLYQGIGTGYQKIKDSVRKDKMIAGGVII